MKHLAKIQTEFLAHLKVAANLDWWESMPAEAQKDYIREHPGTKMHPTPRKPGIPDDPQKMDLARKHVKDSLLKLVTHPGDAHADTYLDDKGNSKIQVKPGDSLFNRVYKKDNQLFEKVPRQRGDEKDHPVNPDEAMSILRHHMGHDPIDPDREREEPYKMVGDRPRNPGPNYNPKPPENYNPGPGSLAYTD